MLLTNVLITNPTAEITEPKITTYLAGMTFNMAATIGAVTIT